jgi:predicted MFS family arabinose efflux permease
MHDTTSTGALPPAAAAGRQHWAGVWSVALSAAAFCSSEFMPVGLLSYIADDLAISTGTAGMMVTVPALLAAAAAACVLALVPIARGLRAKTTA